LASNGYRESAATTPGSLEASREKPDKRSRWRDAEQGDEERPGEETEEEEEEVEDEAVAEEAGEEEEEDKEHDCLALPSRSARRPHEGRLGLVVVCEEEARQR
jgi:archaellum component FlaD/FlaE